MNTATFVFDNSLQLFLPRHQRQRPIVRQFDWRGSIKDMIESLGVPHCEINLLVVNGHSVDFQYIVQDQDFIEVYADDADVDVSPRCALRPPLPPEEVRFVLDTHLGRLAAYLRMLGFDTLYRNDYEDEELALISANEKRVLLTRDVGLLKRGIVTYGYFVRALRPQHRLNEIIHRYKLVDVIQPFRHCMKCNGHLQLVEKASIIDRLPIDTATFYDEFHLCQTCQQIYWKGPHYERMMTLITQVMAAHGVSP